MTARLLELCGFEPEQIRAESPRIEKAFEMLGLTAQDVNRAEERITSYFDIELKGVRQIFGVYLRELVDLVLAKEQKRKKVFYASIPTACQEILTAATLASEDVVVAFPDVLFELVVGAWFDKLGPVLEAAEKLWLAPEEAHCGLIKTRVGLLALDLIPKPDLLVSVGMYCDEAPKSDELLHTFLGVPVQYLNRCQDRGWDEPGGLKRDADFFAGEIRKCARRIGDIVGIEISDDLMAQGRQFAAQYAMPMYKHVELVSNSDPMALSAAHTVYIRYLNSMAISKKGRLASAEAINTLYQEVHGRVNKGEGVTEKGAPRVIHAAAPSSTDPGIIRMLEQQGVAVSVVEAQLFEPDGRLVPDVAGIEDPHERLASAIVQASFLDCLGVRIRSLVVACRRLKADGVFYLLHHACRGEVGCALAVKDAVEKELGIPCLVLEADNFDARQYGSGQLRTRIEAFAEMLRAPRTG